MKTGTVLIVLGVFLMGAFITESVIAHYDYATNYSSYWDLSDKSSTIVQKSAYLDQFVSALEASGLQGSNEAMFFKTPTRGFDQNMVALKSLQKRMHDIIGLDESNFAYQTAMQQITAQEQGQADDMLGVFHQCWLKVHYYALWNDFIALGWFFGSILLIGIGGAVLAA